MTGEHPIGMPGTASDELGGIGARLDLLVEAGEVTPAARQLTDEAVREITNCFGVAIDENNGAQLVTHLAMALSRLERGGADTSTPPVGEDEIEPYVRERCFVESMLARCGHQLGRDVPRAEVLYMTLHLVALVSP